MGLLEDLSDHLMAAGVGLLSHTLFLGRMPADPDNVVALFETLGLPPSYTHHAYLPALERPGVQLLVRDLDYADGRERMQVAYEALCAVPDYLLVQAQQPPFAIGRDEHNRARFSANFVITQRGG